MEFIIGAVWIFCILVNFVILGYNLEKDTDVDMAVVVGLLSIFLAPLILMVYIGRGIRSKHE